MWKENNVESNKKRMIEEDSLDAGFPQGSIIEPNEQKEIGASVECSSRYSKRGRFCVTFSRKRSMRHFGPSIGQTTGGKFFFLSFLSLLPPPPPPFFFFLLLFFRHLSILCKLSKVCSRRTRGSSILESADRYIYIYISFPRSFVTSFDSLIQYRFSIASQRIFLEDRRIRNSLFSR